MRVILVAMLMVAPATVLAGDPPKPPRTELERPAAGDKPVDGKQLCTLVNPDPNAPSSRGDCVTEHEPIAQRPTEKSPPGGPGNDATPSARGR